MQDLDIRVEKLTDKLGYGGGGISHVERREFVSDETIAKVEEAIQSPDILVPIDTDKDGNPLDDDGCGDGRRWKRIFEGAKERLRSLNRSKVFGGGVAMTAASLIGTGKAAGNTLNNLFHKSIGFLKDKRIGFGAHTDDHAHGENCGCGAFDRAPEAIANAVLYEDQIRGSIDALGVDTTGLDEVFDNFRSYNEEIQGQPYSGREVAEEIMDNGKIVKELTDDHREMYIALNMVEGYTINQELIRQVSNDEVQIFGVDVWRMKQIAERLHDEPAEQQKAFLSQLVYTLAVGATLTLGDLPVYIVSQEPAKVAA